MSELMDKWEQFKEIAGLEYAMNSLEQALGTAILEDHIEYILRMNDWCIYEEEEGK